MKKGLFIFSIIIAILVCLFIFSRMTGMLVMYKCPSGANEPTLQVGTTFLVSNLKKPERFDLLIYEHESQESPSGKEIVVHRICGVPGDILELKDGALYVNGKNTDTAINLFNEYIVKAPAEMQKIRSEASLHDEEMLNTGFVVKRDMKDSLVANLSSQYVAVNHIQAKRFIWDAKAITDAINKQWHQSWSADNFGPVTVPTDSFFVMGDNRHNSNDSRFNGFIGQKQYKGIVFGKK
jgi:signal peptidase I